MAGKRDGNGSRVTPGRRKAVHAPKERKQRAPGHVPAVPVIMSAGSEFAGAAKRWDGNSWQQHALQLLRATYGAGNVQEVFADVGGDGGLDAIVVGQGIVYQFYAPDGYATARELYERQRAKLTKDLGKFIENRDRLQKLLRGNLVSRWILLVPFLRHSELIAHAAEKADEVRKAKLSYVRSDRFEVVLETEGTHAAALSALPKVVPCRFEDPWGQLAFESKLWPADADAIAPELREAVGRLASVCWHLLTAIEDSGRNPWQDVKRGDEPADVLDVAYRTTRLAERLAGAGGLDLKLSTYEVAALLAAPFLREAALSSSEMRICAEAEPFSFEDRPAATTTSWLRLALEATYGKRPQLERKARRLASTVDHTASRAVVWWLVQRTAAALPETWEPSAPGGRGLFPAELSTAVDEIVKRLPRTGGASVLEPLRMTRFLAAEPDGFDEMGFTAGRDVIWERPEGGQYTLRPALVGRLLGLLGALACDPRRLPDVVVDHIGLTEPTDARTAIQLCRQAVWRYERDRWTLTLNGIPHPAYDLAFEEIANGAARYGGLLITDVRRNPRGIEELANLPWFRADLHPRRDAHGHEEYVRPHVRFELATDEIKELLMGYRLYGDPMVAVRELYQNALDACRYREARIKARAAREALAQTSDRLKARSSYDTLRERYLVAWKAPRAKDARGGAPTAALIRLDQRVVDGRLIIECTDDGIGMSRRELERCFARAGRRFSDTDEFTQERAAWRDMAAQLGLEELDRDAPEQIDFTPHSQFGIGVFSYFMLADEIEVLTRRVRFDHTGQHLGDTLCVRVSSSGSLFRITRAAEQGQPPGTSVRLILGQTHYKRRIYSWMDETALVPISLLEAMRSFLVVAEFETCASESGKPSETWSVDELHVDPERDYPLGEYQSQKFPRAFTTLRRGSLWWATSGNRLEEFPILADGVTTHSSGPPGLIVNLRGGRRPLLTVDRMKVIDPTLDWVLGYLYDRSVLDLLPPSTLTYDRLVQIAQHYPRLAHVAHCEPTILESSIPYRVGGMSVRLCEFGLWPGDPTDELRDLTDPREDDEWRAFAERCGPYHIATKRLELLKRLSTSFDELLERWFEDPGGIDWKYESDLDAEEGSRIESKSFTTLAYGALKGVVSASLDFRVTIGEAVVALRGLVPAAFAELGQADALFSHRVRRHDKMLLSEYVDGRAPWLMGRVEPAHLIQASAKVGWTLGKIREHLSFFRALGIEVPAPFPEMAEYRATPTDVRIVQMFGPDGRLTPTDLVRLSAMGLSFGEISDWCVRFAPLGIEPLRIPSEAMEVRADAADLILISCDLDGQPPWMEGPINWVHIRGAALETKQTAKTVASRLRVLLVPTEEAHSEGG